MTNSLTRFSNGFRLAETNSNLRETKTKQGRGRHIVVCTKITRILSIKSKHVTEQKCIRIEFNRLTSNRCCYRVPRTIQHGGAYK